MTIKYQVDEFIIWWNLFKSTKTSKKPFNKTPSGTQILASGIGQDVWTSPVSGLMSSCFGFEEDQLSLAFYDTSAPLGMEVLMGCGGHVCTVDLGGCMWLYICWMFLPLNCTIVLDRFFLFWWNQLYCWEFFLVCWVFIFVYVLHRGHSQQSTV